MNLKKLGLFFEVLLDIIIIGGAGLVLTLPFWIDIVIKDVLLGGIEHVPSLIFFYVGGLAGLWFMVSMRSMTVSVRRGNPFVAANVSRLKQMSVACIILMLDFIYLTVVSGSVLGYFCILLLLLAGLAALICAWVFARAIEFKAENDLTI